MPVGLIDRVDAKRLDFRFSKVTKRQNGKIGVKNASVLPPTSVLKTRGRRLTTTEALATNYNDST